MLNIKKHLVLLMLLTISLACGVVHAGAQLSYRMGSRTVLGPDGSLQDTRLIVRTQLLSDNNTFVWNTTDYTDGVCTEMSFHTIRPTSNDGAYQWLGTVSTPGSIQAKINASLHKNDNSGFYGAGTFTTPSGFVVNFSFLWLQGLSDYQALTFVDALSGEITGITLEDTLETDKKTWAALHASFGSCSFQHTSYDSGNGLSGAAITSIVIGSVIGGVIVLLLVVMVMVWVVLVRRRKSYNKAARGTQYILMNDVRDTL